MTGLTTYDSVEHATLATMLGLLKARNIATHQIVSIYHNGTVHIAVFKT
jgi:hypothetical protein